MSGTAWVADLVRHIADPTPERPGVSVDATVAFCAVRLYAGWMSSLETESRPMSRTAQVVTDLAR
jgi:hypothetical protein